jgi:hypothetical protein
MVMNIVISMDVASRLTSMRITLIRLLELFFKTEILATIRPSANQTFVQMDIVAIATAQDPAEPVTDLVIWEPVQI